MSNKECNKCNQTVENCECHISDEVKHVGLKAFCKYLFNNPKEMSNKKLSAEEYFQTQNPQKWAGLILSESPEHITLAKWQAIRFADKFATHRLEAYKAEVRDRLLIQIDKHNDLGDKSKVSGLTYANNLLDGDYFHLTKKESDEGTKKPLS